MPCEFVTNFDAKYPVILGGLLSSEDTLGFIQVSFPHSFRVRTVRSVRSIPYLGD